MKKLIKLVVFSLISVLSACAFPDVDGHVSVEIGPVTRTGLFQVSAPLKVTNPFKFKLCVPTLYLNSVDLTLERLSDGAQAYPQDYYPGEENPLQIPHYYGSPIITRPVFILAPGENFETTAQVDLRYTEGSIHIPGGRYNQHPTPNGLYGFQATIAVYQCRAVNYEFIEGEYQVTEPIRSRIGQVFLSSEVSEALFLSFDAIRATFDPEALVRRNSRYNR